MFVDFTTLGCLNPFFLTRQKDGQKLKLNQQG